MSKAIRVLQVIGSMNRGGAEVMIMNLYRNIDRSAVQFDFIENTSEKADFDDEISELGGKIYHCPHYNGKNHFEYKKWWNDFFKAHKGEYRIIHGHLGSTAAIYLKIAKKHGLYTIAHSHNTSTKRSLNSLVYSIFSYPTRYIADHFFICSRAAGISRYGKAISDNSDKCTLLHNSIEADKFRFNSTIRNEMQTLLNVKDKLVIGHIGRFNAQKNHSFLIDIFSEIHRRNPNSILLLAGGGKDMPSIQDKVQSLGLANAVQFLGVRSDISSLMQAMDVIVFPSIYEGLPVTIIEAQAAGLPCLLSKNVSDECKITDNIEFFSLEKSPSEWADKALEMASFKRKDTYEQIISAHYDIAENAAWLQQFYLDTAKHGGNQ